MQVGAAGALTLVRADGQLTALDGTTGATVWAVPALGLPATGGTGGKDAAAPRTCSCRTDGAFVRRDPATGAELGPVRGRDVPTAASATRVGPVVVLRLPDRVLAYR